MLDQMYADDLSLEAETDQCADGTLHAAVAALTITADREKMMDFSHPFYSAGIGIATAAKGGNPWYAVLKRFLSLAFLKIAGALALVLFGVGLLVWLFEKRRNPGQFGGGLIKGIGAGFWWSAVTMTTVGYGDKAPQTTGGRVMAIVWMFVAIIIISGFTAAITSSLTVTQLESSVKGPADLPSVRVGAIPDTTGAAYLQRNWISFQAYGTPDLGLKAIREGHIDAFVYDSPIMRYLIHRDFRGYLHVLPQSVLKQDYGIALPPASTLREPVNRVLLQKTAEPAWQETLNRYMGQS